MSTTTNLKLFKHDNPSTNTDQFNIEKAINENLDKLDANAGEIASKIQTLENTTNEKDVSQDTEIKALKSENTLLKSQIPSATVVGETVHLEDSSNMPCQIAPIGASKQETREGYNKFNANATFPITSSGLTVTKEDDGSVTINGTATANYSCVIGTVPLTTIEEMNNKEYTLSLEERGTGSVSNTGLKHSGNDRFIVTSASPTKTGTFAKVDTDSNDYSWALWIISGTVFTNYNIKLCMVEGTESKPYEQYGASPSIEYEAPIESVGDNINLYDGQTETGAINADGTTTTATDRWRSTSFIDVRNLKELSISFFDIVPTDAMGRYYLYDENQSVISNGQITTTDMTIDVTNASYFKFWCLNAQVPNTTKIKICKGTIATPYSPYGQGSIEIYNCNENLFDKNNAKSGYYAIDGTLKENDVNWYYAIIPAIKNTEFTLSGVSSVNSSIGAVELDGSKKFIKSLSAYANKTFTTSEECRYIGISCRVADIDALKLEFGSTATEYIQGESQSKTLYTQQPFRANENVKARFVKQNGVWYEKHNIIRHIFDGTETLQANVEWNTSAPEIYHAFFRPTNWKIGQRNAISNYLDFVIQTERDFTVEQMYCSTSNSSPYLFIKNERLTDGTPTVDNVNKYLAELYEQGNPMYLDYEAETPILIPCTAEQVEVLESFNTYKNVTNISSDSIGELEVTYSKDLVTYIANSIDAQINQAVGGEY